MKKMFFKNGGVTSEVLLCCKDSNQCKTNYSCCYCWWIFCVKKILRRADETTLIFWYIKEENLTNKENST